MNCIKMKLQALLIFSLITPSFIQGITRFYSITYSIPAAYNQKTGTLTVNIADKNKISGLYKIKKFVFEGKQIKESDITFTKESDFNNLKCNWMGDCKLTYLIATLAK